MMLEVEPLVLRDLAATLTTDSWQSVTELADRLGLGGRQGRLQVLGALSELVEMGVAVSATGYYKATIGTPERFVWRPGDVTCPAIDRGSGS